VTPDEIEKRFRFKDNLSTVREKLLEICKQIVIVSHRIQRPEVGLGKSDKEFLMHFALPNDEDLPVGVKSENAIETEFYLKAHRKIDRIISKNLDTVEGALLIYNKYAYILSQKEEVNKLIESKPTREDYAKAIKKY